MSEFSDKLSEYIAKSGSNVYQLAKEASLDRTTLQKTAKGQRLPSLDYIREICQYIKISSKQEEELVRLYKIEKLGHSTVKAWDEIQQIILDIYQLRKNEKSTWHIRFDEVSLKSFNAQIEQKMRFGNGLFKSNYVRHGTGTGRSGSCRNLYGCFMGK